MQNFRETIFPFYWKPYLIGVKCNNTVITWMFSKSTKMLESSSVLE